MIPRHLLIALALLLLAIFGMGFYALHLRSVAGSSQHGVQDTRPVSPPVAGPAESVSLYVANDVEGGLRKREISIGLPREQSDRAREILRALIGQYLERTSTHPLAEGADIKGVFLINGNTAVVDTTAPFADGHRSGIMVEELTLASMAQTLAANMPGVTRIKVLVSGKERETLAGHADLMGFYNTSSASRFVKEGQ